MGYITNVFLLFLSVNMVTSSNISTQLQKVRSLSDTLVHQNSRYCEPWLRYSVYEDTYLDLNFDFRNLIEFDISKGSLKTYALLTWIWLDKGLKWDRKEFLDRAIRLPISKIWFPLMYIVNSEEGTDVLSVADSARVNSYGVVEYETPQIISTLCTPDITKYPFDSHDCTIIIGAVLNMPGFFFKSTSKLQLNRLWKNSVWIVTKGEMLVHQANVTIHMNLERRAYFLTLNLVSPVLILGVMNLFAFTLPQESGERVGFSITILLSFIVFIAFTSEGLPDSKSSVCIFNIFLLIQVIESALILLCLIFMSWLYYIPESTKVPRILRVIASKKKGKISSRTFIGSETGANDEEECNWMNVSVRLNRILGTLFIIIAFVEKPTMLAMILR